MRDALQRGRRLVVRRRTCLNLDSAFDNGPQVRWILGRLGISLHTPRHLLRTNWYDGQDRRLIA